MSEGFIEGASNFVMGYVSEHLKEIKEEHDLYSLEDIRNLGARELFRMIPKDTLDDLLEIYKDYEHAACTEDCALEWALEASRQLKLREGEKE